tara:strand:+ start:405 stop:1196 length:792 start_codon:yes stop_codon:yes gene_type:complete
MKIMGIINLSDDSFSDKGKFSNVDDALVYAKQCLQEPCEIIDIGAESTKTHFKARSDEEQLLKLIPLIESVKREIPDVQISADTRSHLVAAKCIDAGCQIINTVTSGDNVDSMLDVIESTESEVIFTHMPEEHTKGINMITDNIVDYLRNFFNIIRSKMIQRGMNEERLIIDPGISFGKTGNDNLTIIKNIETFVGEFGRVCLGVSHKKFSSKVYDNLTDKDQIYVDLSIHSFAAYKGVEILRVHDVDITHDLVKVVSATVNS